MKAILRSAVLVAGLASTLAITTSANAAPAAAVFSGNAQLDCFGCGDTHGTADLTLTGAPSGSVHADFTANEPGGGLCLVTGTANGTVEGAINTNFNWTRVGATAVITLGTPGTTTFGAGVAVFVASGITCGAAVTATVAGVAAGNI